MFCGRVSQNGSCAKSGVRNIGRDGTPCDERIPPTDGSVDSNYLDWCTRGAVLPNLFAIPDADGLVDHPGSHAVSVASMGRPQDWQEARADLSHSDYRGAFVDHRASGIAAEFLCRYHS